MSLGGGKGTVTAQRKGKALAAPIPPPKSVSVPRAVGSPPASEGEGCNGSVGTDTNVGVGGVEAPTSPRSGRSVREAVTAPTPDSASTRWMRHYVINDCPHCWVGDTAEQSHFCAKGQRLREAALAEFRAIPPPPKKRPADTSFNPSIESQGR